MAQNTELAAAGAGNRFDLEQAQTNANELVAQIAAARAAEQEVREKLSGRVNGELAPIAGVKAQITTAQAQIRVAMAQIESDPRQAQERALGSGTDHRDRARQRHDGQRDAAARSFFVTRLALDELMTYVDNEYQMFALFNQNELHQVEPGNEAEITLDTYPGRIIKAHVDSIIWAQSQGQMDAIGNLPTDHRRRRRRASSR